MITTLDNSSTEHVVIAVLAKNKEACLARYLRCIESQTFPKNRIDLYFRTNNNTDQTVEVIEKWISCHGDEYASVFLDKSDFDINVQKYGNHEWNEDRFTVMRAVRQASIDYTLNLGKDKPEKYHYFVIDCDNFIVPETLQSMMDSGYPVIAPMLESDTMYSNYHSSIDANGYFQSDAIYAPIRYRQLKGVTELPVVHCTYFIHSSVLPDISYYDDTNRYEYVIFSSNCRLKNIPQHLDNRVYYGHLTMADDFDAVDMHAWINKFPESECVSRQNMSYHSWENPESTKMMKIFSKIYKESTWGNGSGPGSSESYTVQYRSYLAGFIMSRQVKTVLDIGCGDWQFSHLMDWESLSVEQYLGLDCVESVIDENITKYKSTCVNFRLLDITENDVPETACGNSKWDLIILKDVVQHWPSSTIKNTLEKLRGYCKYILLTNCYTTLGNATEINIGEWQRLSRFHEPLKLFDPEFVLMFGSKETVLIQGV